MSIAERGGGDDDFDFDHDRDDDLDDYYHDDYYHHSSSPYYRSRTLKGEDDGSFPLIIAIPAYFMIFAIINVFLLGIFVFTMMGWQETSPLYEYQAVPWQIVQETPQVLLSNNFWFETVLLYQSDYITVQYQLADNTSRLELLVLTQEQFVNWNNSKPYTPSHDVILTGTPQNITITSLTSDQLYYLVLYNAPSLNDGNPVTLTSIRAEAIVKSSTITGYTTIRHEGAISSMYIPLPTEALVIIFLASTVGLTALTARRAKRKSHQKEGMASMAAAKQSSSFTTKSPRMSEVCLTPASNPQQKFCQNCGNLLPK